MAQNHRELITACVEVLNSFKNLPDDDHTFITEVFSGCVRYHSVISVVTEAFYNRDGKNVLRSEENLYRVFVYLAIFRLDELGMPHFRKFVRAVDLNKMHKFLNFFFNDKSIRTWMKDSWVKIYDTSFVQTTLLSSLLGWLPELEDLLQQMQKEITNKLKLKKETVSSTEVKPFNLTRPRPRSVPMPMPRRLICFSLNIKIPKLKPFKPTPKTTYEKPEEENIMAAIREKNRRRAEEHLMEASRQRFACANPEKSEKTQRRMRDILVEEEQKLDFERHKSHPFPKALLEYLFLCLVAHQDENIPIKLNATSILREGKLYRQREQEELKKLERLEAGAKDASDFFEWQRKMRKQDLEAQFADVERRRLEGKLSHEEAIIARQNLIQENQEKARSMREEAAGLMQAYMERKMQEEIETRELVEKVLDTHENAKEAKKKLQVYKAKIVQAVTEESRELMKQALEEAEAEMQQKMLLIRQIRAAQAVPKTKFKTVDLAENAGYGFLGEMSIVELKERLSLLRMNSEAEEENKRDDILNTKQEKEQLLMETLETINRHRTEQSKAAAIRLEERKKGHNAKAVVDDPKLIDLQRKLEEKRQERKAQQTRLKIQPNKKTSQKLKQINAAKHMMEESRWRELEQRQEKIARLTSTNNPGRRGVPTS
ncbi:hypothetical protein CAPTEDRAFT_191698 [Capitella teleta]|uniref:Cilia- and flagella-associated protein 99 n=1 Tax=Capitella teleta TaxID=283909 RepID=R7V6Q7_CAPTE|nr:hypothetical protein CAPTEDRAFT_191698 [Capitella teleta]|eukprot:ELU14229.1 hypothetical protein CAPTEDRAFT_191698 [Capitella teleta]